MLFPNYHFLTAFDEEAFGFTESAEAGFAAPDFVTAVLAAFFAAEVFAVDFFTLEFLSGKLSMPVFFAVFFAAGFAETDFATANLAGSADFVAGSLRFRISLRVGGMAPCRVQTMDAALLAKKRASYSSASLKFAREERDIFPFISSQDRNAPWKVSPAPMVSATGRFTTGAFTVVMLPSFRRRKA